MIHVLHLTPQLSRAGGGASAYLHGLVRATAACGVANHIASVRDEFTEQDTPDLPAASIFAGKPTLNPESGFSRELHRYLTEDLPPIDIIHSHGLRNGIGIEALHVKDLRNVPLLITPHGMLYQALLQRGRTRKWLVNHLWDNRYRAAADAFHATSASEATVIHATGVKQPIRIVPIGIKPNEFNLPRSPRTGKKTLLFLGIMDRKKGLLRLAQAWGKLHRDFADWQLIIAGPDSDGHADEVRAELARLNAADAVSFPGPVYGEAKARLYRDADLFVLPTDWENFGIAVAEALASELPVITTVGAPWSELQRFECGWWIEQSPAALESTLRKAMQLSDEDRAAMGRRGRELITSRYSWPTIAAEMRKLYESILNSR
jgi:glycosyltransferase involved in cell wall biosynthesis